ncbi:AcrR family transcriptional regulator [Pseudarthrobacter siccitolerans]|uniref:AcrR family transcriptional regulator n=1 Tax=Pseudarthrobacter siccitolerans TaxID=861266 RepID=A0ABU0PLA7_9MICC|nr:TetR/AcrR family transcriptional regulator [Pseudarthrobacter siccitolerans]MDQ0674720.1 AcrR family transcriptional regulator [Pseudarthrobacter siccitolerans]
MSTLDQNEKRQLEGQVLHRVITDKASGSAADAGVSASLVKKLFLSKEKLFAAVQPEESLLAEVNVPTLELGIALVFRVLMRQERGMQEPWATIPLAVLNSPNPEAARTEIRERYLDAIAQLIGDTTPDRRFASTVTALMTGFGGTMRTLGLFDGWDLDELVEQYGAIVQTQINASKAAA